MPKRGRLYVSRWAEWHYLIFNEGYGPINFAFGWRRGRFAFFYLYLLGRRFIWNRYQ